MSSRDRSRSPYGRSRSPPPRRSRSPPRREERRDESREDRDKRALFLNNIPYTANQDDILDLRAFRRAIAVRIALDRSTGRPRGFAHVEFKDEEATEDAFEDFEQGQDFRGRPIYVDFCGAKSRRKPRGGGGRGRSPPRRRSPPRDRYRDDDRRRDDRHDDRRRDRHDDDRRRDRYDDDRRRDRH